MSDPMPGDIVRFNKWLLYKDEELPDIPPEQYTGEIIESWGICRTFFRVKRDYDGRKVIMFLEDVAEIVHKKPVKSQKWAGLGNKKTK